MAKGVHPDQGGRSFVFLTDGQCHMRQCLHHETCSKNTTLPSYYNRFYDLRKEFRKRYDRAGMVDGIRSMLDCILLVCVCGGGGGGGGFCLVLFAFVYVIVHACMHVCVRACVRERARVYYLEVVCLDFSCK